MSDVPRTADLHEVFSIPAFARVELYRWEHGELPGRDPKPLDEPTGMVRMAEAIERGDPKNFPTPFNVSAVLRYAAGQLKQARKPNQS